MDATPPTASSPPTTTDDPNPTVHIPPKPKPITTTKNQKKKNKNKKTKKPITDLSDSDPPPQPQSSSCSSSSCCTSSYSHSTPRGIRVSSGRRNPRVLMGSGRHKETRHVEALALPLGMSIAAFVSQVLERKAVAGERMTVDHLSMICTLAVRESLANGFGDKFDCFVRNFEKSFRSTLMTLRLINETSQSNGEVHPRYLKEESYLSKLVQPGSSDSEGDFTGNSSVRDSQSEAVLYTISSQEGPSSLEEREEHMQADLINLQLALNDGQVNQQLACVPPSTRHSVVNQSMLNIYEKSVLEQARSNNLKAIEIGLTMKSLRLKESQLALNSDLNLLERFKLSMGISKASFNAKKFKNQLEETRHAELLKTCIDCLVTGLFIMLACLGYGTYVYSHKRITEAAAFCATAKESGSWWTPKPISSFKSGLQIVWCQVQVVSRMLFGVLMILAITYLLLQRSATSTRTMPVTFILLLLGVACGFAGKLCIDTLGGSGYYWLFYWEVLCALHFFSNVCTSALFIILYGPVTVSESTNGSTLFPFWCRRFLFYVTILLLLPLLCGFSPFASRGEWKDHFSLLVVDLLPMTVD